MTADGDPTADAGPEIVITLGPAGGGKPLPEPGPLLALALSFLADTDATVERLSEDTIGAVWPGSNGPVDLVVHERRAVQHLLVYASWPGEVPAERRGAVMELVTRTNPSLPTAWFELDLDQGKVFARAALNARGVGGELVDTFAENVITVAAVAMDALLPTLEAVVVDGVELADAPPPAIPPLTP
jgi:hypothetical protein